MKKSSKLFVTSLILLITFFGCSKDDNSNLANEIVDKLVVGSSQFVEGSIPDEGIVYSPFDVDSNIEVQNDRGAVSFKARADKPVSLLLIQFEGIDGYFQVVYDKDGDFIFAKKADAEAVYERIVNMTSIIIWKNSKLPAFVDIKAKIVGVFGFEPGNFPPTRTELQAHFDEVQLGHLSVIRNFRFLFPSFECGVSTVRDFDGNIYNTVKIGTQCWTKENLKTTHYNDSKPLRNVTSNSEWGSLRSGAWCYYNNDASNNDTYGKLYNWYAINKSNLCPKGWHIPALSEWETLKSFLGGATVAGGKIKSTGTVGAGTGLWNVANIGATNSSGFTGHPAGGRDFNGLFTYSIGDFGYWWTSTSVSGGESKAYYVLGGNAELYDYFYLKTVGFSCRCVKD